MYSSNFRVINIAMTSLSAMPPSLALGGAGTVIAERAVFLWLWVAKDGLMNVFDEELRWREMQTLRDLLAYDLPIPLVFWNLEKGVPHLEPFGVYSLIALALSLGFLPFLLFGLLRFGLSLNDLLVEFIIRLEFGLDVGLILALALALEEFEEQRELVGVELFGGGFARLSLAQLVQQQLELRDFLQHGLECGHEEFERLVSLPLIEEFRCSFAKLLEMTLVFGGGCAHDLLVKKTRNSLILNSLNHAHIAA